MFQKLLASKHYRLRDSKSRPRLGRAKDLVWSPTKLEKKNKPRLNLEPRQAPGRAVKNNKPRLNLEPRQAPAARLMRYCSLHNCEHFVIRELLSSRKGTNCKRLKWTYPEETKRQLVFPFLAVKPNNWAGVQRKPLVKWREWAK